jgi:uncharacterized membrane protein YhaH (DUF805 family)
MTFGQSIQTCLSKYVTWKGRASRSEFWYFYLFTILSYIGGLIVVEIAALLSSMLGTLFALVYAVGMLALFLPYLSVLVRRLHDTNRSGWWYWIVLVPLLGVILLIVFFCTKGTDGENRYGPDPLGSSGEVFS